MATRCFFRADPDGGVSSLCPLGVNPATWDEPLFKGKQLGSSWRAPRITLPRALIDRDVDEPLLPLGDFAWLSVAVAASPRMQALLGHRVADQVEFLDVLPDDEPVSRYRILNILHRIDAVDPDASDIEYVGTERRVVYRIRKYGWRRDVIGGLDIFRLSIQPGFTYVSAEIKDLIERSGARGLKFVPLSV